MTATMNVRAATAQPKARADRYISVMVDSTIPLSEIMAALRAAGFVARWEGAPGLPFALYIDDRTDRVPPPPPPAVLEEKGVGDKVFIYGECKTRDAALAAIKQYVDSFPPEGYSTVLAVSAVEPWTITGQRYASCE